MAGPTRRRLVDQTNPGCSASVQILWGRFGSEPIHVAEHQTVQDLPIVE
jgi:hypothetical protein